MKISQVFDCLMFGQKRKLVNFGYACLHVSYWERYLNTFVKMMKLDMFAFSRNAKLSVAF